MRYLFIFDDLDPSQPQLAEKLTTIIHAKEANEPLYITVSYMGGYYTGLDAILDALSKFTADIHVHFVGENYKTAIAFAAIATTFTASSCALFKKDKNTDCDDIVTTYLSKVPNFINGTFLAPILPVIRALIKDPHAN